MDDKYSDRTESLLHKQQVENELDEELDSYLQASVAEKVKSGMTPENARHAALVELGSRSVVKHQVWSSRWESTLDSLLLDMKISFRTLVKSPGFTAIALLSIALGIGANTAIFTLIHQVILRDLPVQDPQQLVTFGTSTGGGILGGADLGFNSMFPWDFAHQLERNSGPFKGIASYSSFAPSVSVRPPSSANPQASAPSAILAPAVLVSGNYFSVLGAQPLFGRTINASDNATPGSGAVVVVSEHFWRQSLSADPDILGKIITINSAPFTVIGVMPNQFHGIKLDSDPTALWTPIMMQPVILQQPSFLGPNAPYFLEMFARLSPAASSSKAALAQSQLWLNQQIRAGVRAMESGTISPARQKEINLLNEPLIPAQRGVSFMRGQYGNSLIILMAVVILVLLIACANLANFLLARAATRQREIATRLALGSSRRRIIRQSLIEALSLSMIGGVIGLAIAFAATRALIAFVSQGSANTTLSSTPDATVLLFTLAASLFSLDSFSASRPPSFPPAPVLPARSAPMRAPLKPARDEALASGPKHWSPPRLFCRSCSSSAPASSSVHCATCNSRTTASTKPIYSSPILMPSLPAINQPRLPPSISSSSIDSPLFQECAPPLLPTLSPLR